MLAQADLPAARSRLKILAEAYARMGRRRGSFLLFDLLCRVDRIVAGTLGVPPPGLPERARIADRLGSARDESDIPGTFASLCEKSLRPMGDTGPRCHPTIARAKAFVQQNYTRKLCLANVAQSLNMSRGYLSSLFRNHCGVTLTEYIHRVRMREAERLLAGGEHSISQVGYAVGYQNYRDFHRNFVRYEKVSPRTFAQVKGRPGRLPPARVMPD